MRDEASGFPKIYLFAALGILLGFLAPAAVYFSGLPPAAEPALESPEKAPPAVSVTTDPADPPHPPHPIVTEQQAAAVPPLKSAEQSPPAQDQDRTPDSTDAEYPAALAKDIIVGVIAEGDTAAGILGADVRSVMQASRRHHSLANLRSGQPYTVVRDRESKALELFEYEMDARRKLVVEKEGASFTSRVETIAYEIQLALLRGTVESSLFQAVAALGESPALALVVAEVFRWDIDFIRDVQEGDGFSILVEKRSRDGRFKNYGRVLGATFTNKGKLFEAFLFQGGSGAAGHYNSKGESLRKVMLRAPLPFTRVTSGYSRGRVHPIFHDVRAHEGIDYAAPAGTPVKAVGNGVISRKGVQGGYGNTLAVRHGAGLESQYAHLSGYARGMAEGVRVRQGQVIGFVGMTGWATGPHLDFRIKQHGRFINPAKAVNPREESIAPGRMKAFEARKTQIRNFVAGATPLDAYAPDEFL